MEWLNYHHLFYFWHVAKRESFSEASRHLSLTQPTVSAQIRTLEEALGVSLFRRDGRGIRLSATGAIVYRYADQIFGLGQELLDVLHGEKASLHAELKIGVSDVVPKSLAYRIIKPALDQSKVVRVSCYEDKTDRLLADLAIGDIDLVVADQQIPHNVKIKAFNHSIGDCGVTFLAHPDVAKKHKALFPKSLSSAALLLPTTESAVRGEIDVWLERLGVRPNVAASFQDRTLLKIAARDRQGIIPVPSLAEKEIVREYGLAVVGRTTEVRERLFLISAERRIRHPVLSRIYREAQERFRLSGR